MKNVWIAPHSSVAAVVGIEIAAYFKLVELTLRHQDRPQEVAALAALAVPSRMGTAATKQALGQDLRKRSGSLGIFAAIRRALNLYDE